MALDAQVIVVGAGPVGLTAALALARQGVETLVLEREPDLLEIPRASTFHPPTLERLDQLELTPLLLQEGYKVPTLQYRERREGIVAEFDFNLLADETPYPFRLQCPQHRLARLALGKLERVPAAEVRFSSPVDSVEVGDGSATVRLNSGETASAAFVIAADGASSNVRSSLAIPFEGKTYEIRNLQIQTSYNLHGVFPDLALVNYVFDPKEWGTLLRTPPGVWRVGYSLKPDESDEQALDDAAIADRLGRLIGGDGWSVPVEYKAVYGVHQRVARTFRDRRVVLIGDAAHINSPIGGMGMNSGIHDACSLVASLPGVLRGEVAEQELDAWASRRRDVAVELVGRQSDRNTRDLMARSPEERRERNDRLRALAADTERARSYLRRVSMMEMTDARPAVPAQGGP